MKSLIFIFGFIGLLVFQNCGSSGYRPYIGGEQSVQESHYKSEIKSISHLSYPDTSGKYFSKITINFSDDSAFFIIEESGVCTRNFQIDEVTRESLLRLFDSLTFRTKQTPASLGSVLPVKFDITSNGLQTINAYAVTNEGESTVAQGGLILNEIAAVETALKVVMERSWAGEDASCLVNGQIPDFVEYRHTDVQNNLPVVLSAFLTEIQGGGASVFLGFPDASTCYKSYQLNLKERGMLIRNMTRELLVQDNANTSSGQGVKYMSFHYEANNTVNQYHVDQALPIANTQLLINGEEIISDTNEIIRPAVEQRYSAAGLEPVDIQYCIIQ